MQPAHIPIAVRSRSASAIVRRFGFRSNVRFLKGLTMLRGNWATLLLPINADDSIDFARLDDELVVWLGRVSTEFIPTARRANSTTRPKRSSIAFRRCLRRAVAGPARPSWLAPVTPTRRSRSAAYAGQRRCGGRDPGHSAGLGSCHGRGSDRLPRARQPGGVQRSARPLQSAPRQARSPAGGARRAVAALRHHRGENRRRRRHLVRAGARASERHFDLRAGA